MTRAQILNVVGLSGCILTAFMTGLAVQADHDQATVVQAQRSEKLAWDREGECIVRFRTAMETK